MLKTTVQFFIGISTLVISQLFATENSDIARVASQGINRLQQIQSVVDLTASYDSSYSLQTRDKLARASSSVANTWQRVTKTPVADPIRKFAVNSEDSEGLARKLKTIIDESGGPRSAEKLPRSPIEEDSTPDSILSGMTAKQQEGISRLKQHMLDSDGFKIEVNQYGTPAFIQAGNLSEATLDNPENRQPLTKNLVARNFLRNNRGLLRLSDPDSEMSLIKSQTDELDMSHFRFQQRYQGVAIWGKEAVIHVNQHGAIYLFQGTYIPTPTNIDVQPTITDKAALTKIYKDLEFTGRPYRQPVNELVLYPLDDTTTLQLAWHVEVSLSPNSRWHYFVDAKTGSIIHRYSGVLDGVSSASGLDLFNKKQSFTAWKQGAQYFMVDVTKPINDQTTADPIKAPGLKGDIVIQDANNKTTPAFFNIPATANPISGWDKAAVSAISNIYQVFQYFAKTHKRKSIDDNNGSIFAVVHYASKLNNAFWDGKAMHFGDGDGQVFTNLAKSLDVTAHELAHGVTQYSANLEYEAQSGALNESFSDIFGVMVDRDDWILGEDVTLINKRVLRDMRDPHQSLGGQPAKMSEYENLPLNEDGDYGGVHVNSGIPNRAFFLIAEGLTTEKSGTSIGKVKAEKIFYRALTQYLQKHSQFVDARRATLQSAIDLFGKNSPEWSAVKQGWDLVEVVETTTGQPRSRTPSATDPIKGQDRVIDLWAGDLYLETPTRVFGPLNTLQVLSRKPAVFVSATDTIIFYVDANTHNLRYITVSNGKDQLVAQGDFWSICLSQDGSRFAYTRDFEEPYLYVEDLVQEKSRRFKLTNPGFDSPTGADTVVYADFISFDYRGFNLVYDVLNRLEPTNAGSYSFWGIGVLDVRNGNIIAPVPSQDISFDIGAPVFASNNNFILAYDVLDKISLESGVFLHNTVNQKIGFVISPDLTGDHSEEYGLPSFRGDDQAITVQAVATLCNSAGCFNDRSLYSIPIKKTNGAWVGIPNSAKLLSIGQAISPVMYRNGLRVINAKLTTSAKFINFGQVKAGSKVSRNLVISNTGNTDVYLNQVNLLGVKRFKHNGINGRIPRRQKMTVKVTFQANLKPGLNTGTLILKSDANKPFNLLTVKLQAKVI